ncbi:MAG: antitoxin family protein [Rhodocyclaceae bacterium]|nr:antitoxin family protein [Rhodocyclaceae bacterium]
MSHTVEAIYEDGVLKLKQPLPLQDQEEVRVTVESLGIGHHSILDIAPVSLGSVLRPFSREDLLGEMLKGRE